MEPNALLMSRSLEYGVGGKQNRYHRYNLSGSTIRPSRTRVPQEPVSMGDWSLVAIKTQSRGGSCPAEESQWTLRRRAQAAGHGLWKEG